MEKIEIYFLKYLTLLKSVFVLIIIFIVVKSYIVSNSKTTSENILAWTEEENLKFEGVITEYNGFGSKTKPIFLMIGDSIYKIPRYNAEIFIRIGDTIKKLAGEHKYYFKRNRYYNNEPNKRIDTIEFDSFR
jgi:hypothetical protein